MSNICLVAKSSCMRYFSILFLFCYFATCFSQSIGFQFKLIEDLNNSPVSSYDKGRVDYPYEMGTLEITNRQYCIFLNNVKNYVACYELYNPLMSQHFFGGILYDTSNDSYRCKAHYEEKPVVGLTWMSVIRFINWLHYNSHLIEQQKPVSSYLPFTEGDAHHGAYNTQTVPLRRNQGAKYWLPNQNEWIKACYFNGTEYIDTVPLKSNCFIVRKGWAYPFPHLKDVGTMAAPNHYGLYDMIGNAAEWVEDNRDSWKLAYGGSVIRNNEFAKIASPEADSPHKAITTFGFRVCRTSDVKLRTLRAVPNLSLQGTTNLSDFPQHHADVTIRNDKNGGSYVLVDEVDNDVDPLYGVGRVSYAYYISKYELTNAEYCRFLNAVATKDDPFHLYDVNMQISACGGIDRIRKANNVWSYQVKKGYDKLPVVYIGFYELARYANWLHYGCPISGCSVLGTTEGDNKTGAYDTRYFELVRLGKKKVFNEFGKRNEGARFWIPNDDEWYKAAYYNPLKIGRRKYYDYPTQSDDAPSLAMCNYMKSNTLAVGSPYFMASVDSFSNAPSYFGTVQQGGNVWEWLESWAYGSIGHRGLRGGSWSYTEYGLNAVNVDDGGIDDKLYVFGGRLCCSIDNRGYVSSGETINISWKSVLKYGFLFCTLASFIYTFFSLIIKIKNILNEKN